MKLYNPYRCVSIVINEINMKKKLVSGAARLEGDFMDAEEAVAQLEIKPATLYAYVSRGLVRRVRDARTRRSVYARADIDRLGARRHGALSRAGAAATSMRWGEPIINTGITRIAPEGPIYRNKPAHELARSGASFEAVVHLLLTGLWQPDLEPWPAIETPKNVRNALKHGPLAGSADVRKMLATGVLALGMSGRGAEELVGADTTHAVRLILQTLSGSLGLLAPGYRFVERRAGETLAHHALRAAGVARADDKAAVLDRVLIMLADHELAAASFVARVAASTESDLYGCVVAAICAHAGLATAAATDQVDSRLFDALTPKNADMLLELVRERGASRFGFDHPLYPAGDPRAEHILEVVASIGAPDAKVRRFLTFIERVRTEIGMRPGIAVGLTALVHALGMPPCSASVIWILSRTAGWMAHALEQRTQAYMLRPRAKYMTT
jgi:citrate synthase